MYKTRMASSISLGQIRHSYYYIPKATNKTPLLTILRAGWLDAAPGDNLNRAYCLGDDIIYCLSGHGSVTVDDTRITVNPGQLAWLPGDRPHGHASCLKDPWSVMWCRIQGHDLASLRTRILGANDFRMAIKDGPSLVRWFNAVCSQLNNEVADTDLKLNTAISTLLELMASQKRIGTIGHFPRNLERVLRAMCADPSAPWTSADIEAAAVASAAHVRRLFQEHFGLTPREYLRSQRLILAQKLMLDTHQSLHEIAIQCGFSDSYHFSRDFRRVVGIPPSKWRRIEMGG